MSAAYLLPIPQFMETDVDKEPFYLSFDTVITIADACPEETFGHAALLQKEILQSAGIEPAVVKGRPGIGDIVLDLAPDMKEEEYTLEIRCDGIRIKGGSGKGILWGIQSLRQICRQEAGRLTHLTVHDWPEFPVRGFYHDATRGRVPRLTWLKRLADTMSFYKLNQMQIYIEHTYLFRDLSEVWRDDTPLTAEEIMELDRYCRKLGIDLVPSLSSFGHLYKLLRTRTWRHLGEMPEMADEPFGMDARMHHHTINTTLEESYDLVTGLIREYMSLFTSDYFNICADETFDLGKGASKTAAEEKGTDRLYIDFVKRLCEFVISQGKRPMFWGDIICGFPEFIRELPPETICLNWGYAWNEKEDNTKKLAEAGAVQYMCPGVCGWNQFMNRLDYAYSNIWRMCRYGEKYHAVGVLNTDWGDFGHVNHPSLSIPGMIYGAAFSWNKEDIPEERMNGMISLIQYGDRTEQLVSLMGKIAKQTVFDWWTIVSYMERGDKELLNRSEIELLDARDNDKIIGKLVKEIKTLSSQMAPGCRRELLPVYLGAEAICIFDKIGLAVGEREFTPEELRELAQRTEKWFYHYRKLWYTVSRESELRQVGDVIYRYCDLLRDMAEEMKI